MLGNIISTWTGRGSLPATFRAVLAGANGWFRCVDDIEFGWLPIASPPFLTTYGAAYSGALQRFVVVNSAAAFVAISDDGGATWTQHGCNAVLNSVIWVPFLSLFVGVGLDTCQTSPDGITWTAQTIPAGPYNDVAWGSSGNRFVAVGGNKVARSNGGPSAWVAGGTGGATGLVKIIKSKLGAGQNFVATSITGTPIIVSADGNTWGAPAVAINPLLGLAENDLDNKIDVCPSTATPGLISSDAAAFTPGRVSEGRVYAMIWARDRLSYLAGFYQNAPVGGRPNGSTIDYFNLYQGNGGPAVEGDITAMACTDYEYNPETP